MNTLFILSVFIGLSNCMNAQFQKPAIRVNSEKVNYNAATKSAPLQAELIGFRNSINTDKTWRPFLNTVISKNEAENTESLEQLKQMKDAIKQTAFKDAKLSQTSEVATGTLAPVLGTNFAGIDNGGGNSPLDNTIAVSNNGYIVTCVNARIEYDDVAGNYYGGQTLVNLINDASVSTNLCDPKVIYDSGADRFILFMQTCDGLAASSKIIVAFSQTNNPTNGWWIYKFTGNPLNNNCWFDYPKMAVSNNELYISGNLFGDSGGPFNQAVLYQIEKTNGFSGGSVNWQYWYNLAGSPFTLLPVSNGQQGNYGPGVYFVASKGVTAGSTNIDLYDLTNDMSASNETVVHYNVSTTSYATAGNAQQLGSSLVLNTGDSRAQSGFYLNGLIHFVFHSDIGSGYNGINYNRVNISNATNVSTTFGLPGSFEYCYPAVASVGTNASDKAVVVAVSRSGSTIYPEIRALVCDDQMNWSNSILVKGGQSFIDYSWTTSSDERWGDYSGIARKYNSNPPAVWVSGDYGNSSNYWAEWIGEITTVSSIGINELSKTELQNTTVYPNPAVEIYKIAFEVTNTLPVKIEITDVQGKLVKELYNGTCQAGKNVFTFNKAALASGLYFINISSNTTVLKHEKLIIAEK